VRQLRDDAVRAAREAADAGLGWFELRRDVDIVAAEMSAAQAGVGWMIWRAYDMFDIERMFSALMTLAVLGYLFGAAIDCLERLVIPWKQR